MIEIGNIYNYWEPLENLGQKLSATGKSKTLTFSCRCLKCSRIYEVASKTIESGKSKMCQSCRSKKYNIWEEKDSYYIGYTSNTNKPFKVNKHIYEQIKNICWFDNPEGYIVATFKINNEKTIVKLFNYIWLLENDEQLPTKEFLLDHKNGDTYNNLLDNLRKVSLFENGLNRGLNRRNTSGVTGVRFDENTEYWIAYITYNYKQHYLGQFNCFDNAVKARLKAEKEYFGEFARQKFLFEKYGI